MSRAWSHASELVDFDFAGSGDADAPRQYGGAGCRELMPLAPGDYGSQDQANKGVKQCTQLKPDSSALRWSFCGGLCLSAPASVVQAQQADAAQAEASTGELGKIVVTGSRIQRRDYEANSPIVTVDEALLRNSSTAAIETNLTKLPQFHPVQTPTMAGDIQPTATNTPGAATLSLRGLGANRNLVLIDGRRATPGNASQAVDINTIPGMAIERVETITGGASATYGADAVGGVVNFIMRKNFEGFQLDAMTAETSEGDGSEYQVTALIGANMADDKGNVMLAFSTNRRQGSDRLDRSWFRDTMRDPTVGGDEFFPTFFGLRSGCSDKYPFAGIVRHNLQCGGAGQRSVARPGSTSIRMAPLSRDSFRASLRPVPIALRKTSPAQSGRRTPTGLLNQNFQDAGLVLPLQRDNLYAHANYEINDWLGFFRAGHVQQGAGPYRPAAVSIGEWLGGLHSRRRPRDTGRTRLRPCQPARSDRGLAAHVLPGLCESRSAGRCVYLQPVGRFRGQDPGD